MNYLKYKDLLLSNIFFDAKNFPKAVVDTKKFSYKNETEIQRLNILINKTREEIARDYVTRSSFNIEFERVLDKLDKLDAKIDKLITN